MNTPALVLVVLLAVAGQSSAQAPVRPAAPNPMTPGQFKLACGAQLEAKRLTDSVVYTPVGLYRPAMASPKAFLAEYLKTRMPMFSLVSKKTPEELRTDVANLLAEIHDRYPKYAKASAYDYNSGLLDLQVALCLSRARLAQLSPPAAPRTSSGIRLGDGSKMIGGSGRPGN